jgi:hypothetical protein
VRTEVAWGPDGLTRRSLCQGCGSFGVSNKPLAPSVPLEQAVGANGLLAAPGSAPRTSR